MDNSARLLNRLLQFGLGIALYCILVTIIVISYIQSFPLSCYLFIFTAIVVLLYFGARFGDTLSKDIQALEIALLNIGDNNFSVSIPKPYLPEMQTLVDLLNATFSGLRQQRSNIHQKELLLDKVIENAPMAMLLCNANQQFIFGNSLARRLFNRGKRIEGHSITELLEHSPPEFKEAISRGVETLFQLELAGERVSYHFSCGQFSIDNLEHRLYLFKEVTREINRQEVASWKKTIKVISHELNNSLAPISSMAHSSKLLVEQDNKPRLLDVLGRIESAVSTLHSFIQRYAEFARLPLPNKTPIDWPDLIMKLQAHYAFQAPEQLPDWAFKADHVQLQQALINVLKNAHESGSDLALIGMDIRAFHGKTEISIYDRGTGMTQSVMEQAMVPFYSTKSLGSGIGLALCQEIVEAHYGKLRLQNRSKGGLRVSLRL